ncbi:MAG: ABC transporter permease [Candidatus Obscuribacterales bacterium]
MKYIIHDLLIVAKKELRHCSRDGHVLVYSVIIPVIFYPVTFIGISEFALWRQGLSEKSPLRIAVDLKSRARVPELIAELKESKTARLVDVPDPLKSLTEQKIEGYIKVQEPLGKTIAYVNPSSDRHTEAGLQIRYLASYARSKASEKELKRAGLTGDFLNVLSIETESVESLTGKGKSMKDMEDTMLATSLIAAGIAIYTLMVVQAGAIYPALTAFTEELEKKTRSTTRLLPVEKWVVVAGKFISVFIMATGSGLLNIASLAVVVVYLLHRLPLEQTSLIPSADSLTWQSLAVLALLYLVSVAFTASIYCLVGSAARSFKEAQNTSSFVMVLSMATPVIAILPGWTLNWATAFVPILNVVLACKEIFTGNLSTLPLIAVCLETLVVSSVFIYLSQLAFWGLEPTNLSKSAT